MLWINVLELSIGDPMNAVFIVLRSFLRALISIDCMLILDVIIRDRV